MAPKVSIQSQTFKPIKIGAGGWLTGHAQHADGTLLARADVYGGYIWDEAAKSWRQVVTTLAMPKADHRPDNVDGVYEFAIAPMDSADIWMAYNGRIYRSRNRTKTFELTNFKQRDDMKANADPSRFLCRKLAVDPYDSEHVLASAGKDGLWQTRDGGKSWIRVESVALPVSKGDSPTPAVSGIIFDPRTKGRIFASSHGHGVVLSEDGGKSFRQLPGGPVNCAKDCDIAADGTYFAVEQEGNHLWRFDGAWFEISSDLAGKEAAIVTCDPSNANRVAFANFGGSVVITQDRGENISAINWDGADTYSEPDIPWHRVQTGVWMAVGGMTFDKTGKSDLLVSIGIGFLRGKIGGEPDRIAIHWTYNSVGVEELVANQIIATPNGNIGVASWDRAYFRVDNPDQFPDHYDGNYGETIVHCTAIDWCAQDPDVIAFVNFSLGSSVSRDGGRTFKPFGSAPFKEFPKGGGGGEIALGGPDNYVWVPTAKLQPHWTKDGGETWNPIKLPGVPANEEGWAGTNWGYYLKRHILAADRVAPGTFYIWHTSAGVFVSRDGGETWGQAYGGELLPNGTYNAKMRSVPGYKGHLFATSGPIEGVDPFGDFKRSVNGGKTWSSLEGVREITDFGFGAVPPGHDYPAVWIVGYVNNVFGIYRSDDGCVSWILVNSFPLDSLDEVVTIDGDKKIHDRCYIGFGGMGYAYSLGSKAAATPTTQPGFMMVPAAMLYRFGKRWSDLKTAHTAMEAEVKSALADTSVTSRLSQDAVKRLKQMVGM
jgi:hypothetical protein